MSDQQGWGQPQGGIPPQPGQPPQQPGSYGQPPNQPYPQPPNQPYGQAPGQPPADPYGQHYSPPSAPAKRRKWPWILGGVFLLFVLMIGGCSLLVFNLARGPIDGANEWVAMLDDGDFVGAQASMCGGAGNANDPGTLEADFGAGIDDFNLSSVNSTNGVTSVEGTITVGGVPRAATMFMNNENDAWRVCNYVLL